jgi:hypothetical protein
LNSAGDLTLEEKMDKSEALLVDIGIGLAEGAAAARMTAQIENLLYRVTPEGVKHREERSLLADGGLARGRRGGGPALVPEPKQSR